MKLLLLVCVIATAVLVVPGDCRNIRQTRGSPIRLGREWSRRQVEEASVASVQAPLAPPSEKAFTPEPEKPWYKHAANYISDQADKLTKSSAYNSVKDKLNDWSKTISGWFGKKRNAASDFENGESEDRSRRVPDFYY